MKIGKIRSLYNLIESRIDENQRLVFAILQGPDVTDRQKVKFLEYLYKFEIREYNTSTQTSLYTEALILFYPSILNYNGRKRKIKSSATT
jgi:hypothetical protein